LNGTAREAAKVAKNVAPPKLPKESSAMSKLDGRGSLALEVGSQGVLIRLPKKMSKVIFENQG
jgi:hypothetical protein